jgi:competence protein ComEA
MTPVFEPIRNWFGFTRRERRSSFILLIVILLILLLRYAVPGREVLITDITDSLSILTDTSLNRKAPGQSAGEFVAFDPNRASGDTLKSLGLTEREVKTLINYRKSGARFRKPSDIKKVYGIEKTKAENLIPYIKIGSDSVAINTAVRKTRPRVLIELNSSDTSLLETLPGIGRVLSLRIVRYRNLLGGYASVDQLREVYGLPPETFNMIRERVYADTTSVRRININTAGYKELSGLHYLERFEVTSILKYRELKGRIRNISDLTGNNLIPAEKARKIKPYLVFE